LEEKTAKSALVNTVRAAAHNLFRLADPRPWTQEHPWKSTGFAAVAGFVVATQVTPGGTSEEGASHHAPASEAASNPSGPSSWDMVTSLLLSTGTDAMKSALTPWLAQKVSQILQGKAAPATETEPMPASKPQP